MAIENLITDHLDLWTAAVRPKSSAGRGSNSKLELTGIKKLRELILELAVRGKLVPQDPSDEPASVLRERISAEKVRLLNEGKIKKNKALLEIGEEDNPFALPDGWIWQSITDVFYPISVGSNKIKTAEILDVGAVPVVDQGKVFIAGYTDRVDLKITLPGPVIVFGDHTSALKYIDFDFVAGADGVKILRPICICERYFYLVCNTISIESRGYGRHYNRLLDNKFPLPPMGEQCRIVAKVDELMALCDQLEQRSESQLAAHQMLVETLLATLTDSCDAEELAQNWVRLSSHFDILFTTEASIDALKQTILQLAVMGKLVPQDPSDEPASTLLERIASEKARLVKNKTIKQEKSLPEISEEEKLYRVPSSWCFCRLGDICYGITSGSTPPKDKFLESGGVPYLKVYNIRDQKIDFDYQPQFVVKDYNESKLKRSMLYPGDVVMNIVGPPLGKVAIIPNTYPVWNCNQAIVFFRPIDSRINTYIYTYLVTGLFLRSIELIGTAGQDNISVTKSRLIVLPVPPLAEQHRIVAKVDELMALCDQLKSRLQTSQQTQLALAESLVEGALV